jgi:hypothetical protein
MTNTTPESQSGSQRSQTSDDTQHRRENVSRADSHTRQRAASSGDGSALREISRDLARRRQTLWTANAFFPISLTGKTPPDLLIYVLEVTMQTPVSRITIAP